MDNLQVTQVFHSKIRQNKVILIRKDRNEFILYFLQLLILNPTDSF
jgi:hypothetical protein